MMTSLPGLLGGSGGGRDLLSLVATGDVIGGFLATTRNIELIKVRNSTKNLPKVGFSGSGGVEDKFVRDDV